MAYQTNTASVASQDSLLIAWSIFLTTNGWTQDNLAVDGNGYRFHAHKGSLFLNMRSRTTGDNFGLSETAVDGICMNLGTSYSSGLGWYEQPGASTLTYNRFAQTFDLTDAEEYHFFIDGDTHGMAVLSSGGHWNFLAFGETNKGDIWYSGSLSMTASGTSPAYLLPLHFLNAGLANSTGYASCASAIYHNSTWKYWARTGFGQASPSESHFQSAFGLNYPMLLHGVDSFSGGRALVVPEILSDAGSGYLNALGALEDSLALYNGLNDTQGREMILGADTYMVFQATGTYAYPVPTDAGIAYAFKKVL